MSWIQLNKTTLSNTTSSYIMSSGGQSTASRGFAVVYFPKNYIVILSTKNKQWKLDTPVLPSGWFNLAFTWREAGQLKLYVNGTHVASSNPALVSRPRDSFTTFDIGRPNNSDKPLYRFPLQISNLALWERELSEQELKSGKLLLSFLFILVCEIWLLALQFRNTVKGLRRTGIPFLFKTF